MSTPPLTSGPVPIEVQKQVLVEVAHSTATTRAASSRAAWSASPSGPARIARVWMARAATSQARTPTKASRGASGMTDSTTTWPASRRPRVSGTTDGWVKRFQLVTGIV